MAVNYLGIQLQKMIIHIEQDLFEHAAILSVYRNLSNIYQL